MVTTNYIEIDPHDAEGRGIPCNMVTEAFARLKYGSVLSIGVKLLHYTGCRISELDSMNRSNLRENWIYWAVGKNQIGYRKEYLPDEFIEEMIYYWGNNRVPADKLLGVSHVTLSRYFRRERHKLGAAWGLKRTIMKKGVIDEEYYYQLKGFRKNFATLMFAYFYKKFDDANVAIELVSKRLKHSNTGMTITHYIETMEQIDAMRLSHLMVFEIIKHVRQYRLDEFAEKPLIIVN